MNHIIRKGAVIAASMALLPFVAATSVKAQIIENDQSQAGGVYTVNTTNDLLLNATPIASLGDPTAGGGDSGAAISYLTDGLTIGSNVGAGSAAGGNGGGLTSLTYSLGSNATGYNISNIDTYSGWGDGGRFQQSYTVLYSTAAAPSTFLTLYTVNPYGPFGSNQAYIDLSSSTGPLASNVADIQFQFNTTANGWTGYQELGVTGLAAATVSTPEPSTWAMMLSGLGLLALVLKTRRNRVG